MVTCIEVLEIGSSIFPWQPLGPLPKVKLLKGYMYNPTKLKGTKGIRRSPKMCQVS